MANLDEYIRDSGQMINAQTYMEEIANKLKPHDKEFLELVDKAIDILLKAAEK